MFHSRDRQVRLEWPGGVGSTPIARLLHYARVQFLQPVQIAEEAYPKHPRVAGMRKATQSIGAQFERRARLASATQSGFQVAQRLFRQIAEEFERKVNLL